MLINYNDILRNEKKIEDKTCPPFVLVNLTPTNKRKQDTLITVFSLIINTLLFSGKPPIIFSQAWLIPLSSYTVASICSFWYVDASDSPVCIFLVFFFFGLCSVFWVVSSVCSAAFVGGRWVHNAVVPGLSVYSLFTHGCPTLGSVMCLWCLSAILCTALELHNMAVTPQYVCLKTWASTMSTLSSRITNFTWSAKSFIWMHLKNCHVFK